MKAIIYMLLFTVFISILFIYICIAYRKINTYIQLSCSFSYIPYLPIAVKAWRNLGFYTIVIIVYHSLNKEINYIKEILITLGSEVILAKFDNNVSLHIASKMSRIFGFVISRKIKYYDFVYLADVDMIPVSKTFYKNVNYDKLTIKSYGKKGYGIGNGGGRWCMCYMVANKYIWYEILKEDILKSKISKIIATLLYKQMKKGEAYFGKFWYMDEIYLRDRIKSWNKYNSSVIFYKRNFHISRITNLNWPINFSSINKNIIDIHLPRIPLSKKSLLYLWKRKIIPLQLILFHKIDFNISYINTIWSNILNIIKKET